VHLESAKEIERRASPEGTGSEQNIRCVAYAGQVLAQKEEFDGAAALASILEAFGQDNDETKIFARQEALFQAKHLQAFIDFSRVNRNLDMRFEEQDTVVDRATKILDQLRSRIDTWISHQGPLRRYLIHVNEVEELTHKLQMMKGDVDGASDAISKYIESTSFPKRRWELYCIKEKIS
jgi:hypothetical protein